MDDQTPDPELSGAERPVPEERVPDPHAEKPVPAPQEGTRPGADETVRPEQDEPIGPLAGLVGGAGAEASEEARDIAGTEEDPEGRALLEQMGVEEEGVEGGQILGFVAATIAFVAALAIILIYLFYLPYKAEVDLRAENDARATELEIIRAEALAKLDNYGRVDETYRVPISRAMGLVAAEYGSAGGAAEPQVPTITDYETRQQWNLLPVYEAGPGRTAQQSADSSRVAPVLRPGPVPSGEEVGSDVDNPEVDVIEDIDDDPIE